jgi:hypothetical protein
VVLIALLSMISRRILVFYGKGAVAVTTGGVFI